MSIGKPPRNLFSFEFRKWLEALVGAVNSGGGGGSTDHATLTHLTYASSGHTGFEQSGAATSAVSAHNSAYDHSKIATALQTETDPVFTAWDKDYDDLTNKPTIPSKTSDLTNDSGFLTAETDPVFSAWDKDYADLTNKPAIPSKTSDLTNDSGFLTVETDPVFNAWDKDYADLTNKPTIPTKTSELSNDSGFITVETDPIFTAWDKDYSDLTNKPAIPSKTSDLTNDSGFLTAETDPVFSAWDKDYSDLTNKPTIPSKTSDLINDSGFITDYTEPDHNSLGGIQGGTTNQYYHLTALDYADLLDGLDTSLHYHSADRMRSLHTGTQLASTISDFSTAVVAALPQSIATTASPQFANLILTAGGDIKPSANSTTAINIAQADGTNFVSFDSSNKRVGINTTPTQALDIVSGNIKIDATTNANQNGIIYKGTSRFIHDFGYGLNSGGITPTGANLFLGIDAGNLTCGSTATQTYHSSSNVAIGYNAMRSVSTGYSNMCQGTFAGFQITSGYENSCVGTNSGRGLTTGTLNANIGATTMYNNSLGHRNTAVGARANGHATNSGSNMSNNVFLGYMSGYNSSASNNTFLGYQSGYTNSSGASNTYVGYQAGYSGTTNAGNVFIGYQAGYNETGENKLYIDNSNTATPLIYGDFSTDVLTINGSLTVTGTTTISGYQPSLTGSISGTANQVTVTANSNSVASNITLSLPQNIATSSAVQFGSLAIGRALTAAAKIDCYNYNPSTTLNTDYRNFYNELARPNSATGTTGDIYVDYTRLYFNDGNTKYSASQDMYGRYTYIEGGGALNTGTMGNVYGQYDYIVFNNPNITFANIYGQYTYVWHYDYTSTADYIQYLKYTPRTGTVTDVYGLYLDMSATAAGQNTTNMYGLYISNITEGGTLNYSIYTGTAPSVFGGNVNVAKLQIGSTALTGIQSLSDTETYTFAANQSAARNSWYAKLTSTVGTYTNTSTTTTTQFVHDISGNTSSSTNAGEYYGILANATLTANYASRICAMGFTATHNTTTILPQLFGAYGSAVNASTGTASVAIGSYGYLLNSGGGSIPLGNAVRGYANNTNGTVTTLIGVSGYSVHSAASSTVTSAAGIYGQVVQGTASSTITNAIAIWADNPSKSAGTMTNAYGLKIETINAGSTNYSIYTGTAASYFGGSLTVVGTVTTDTIAERTSAAGVTIDGLLVKDGKIPVADSVTTSVDTGWNEVGAAGKPAFANSWVNHTAGTYNTCAYRIDAMGYVHFKGLIKSGSINSAAFTLPAGYRPVANEYIGTISNNAIGLLIVQTDGAVIPAVGNNAWFSLDSCTFRAYA